MAGFDATYEALHNMILNDHFFITCKKTITNILERKGKNQSKRNDTSS